jgi:hypothetical protein
MMRRTVMAILSPLLALVLISCGGDRNGSTEAGVRPNEDQATGMAKTTPEATATPNEDQARAMASNTREATATSNEDQARAMAENMLTAYNSGDYGAFTRDWSSAMKWAMREDAFHAFRDKNLPVTGRFVRLVSLTPTGGEGDHHHSYDVRAEFENGGIVLFTMTLSSDNKNIERLKFKPQS